MAELEHVTITPVTAYVAQCSSCPWRSARHAVEEAAIYNATEHERVWHRFVPDVGVFDGLPHSIIRDSQTGLVALAPDDLIGEITKSLNANPNTAGAYMWNHPDEYQGQEPRRGRRSFRAPQQPANPTATNSQPSTEPHATTDP